MSRQLRRAIPLIAAACVAGAAPAAAPEIEAQRAAFRELYPRAELGDWDAVRAQQPLLESYVLWPDLKAAWLRARLGKVDDTGTGEFLARYGDLKPARELRYLYALQLGRQGRWQDYLDIYNRHYASLGVARLDCLALHADMASGTGNDALLDRAMPLWLVGHSQAEECDPVFERLRQAGRLGKDLYEQRFRLAIDERQFSLARYLARPLPPGFLRVAERWRDAYGRPQQFLDRRDPAADSEDYRRQLFAAVQMQAYDEPLLAATSWQQVEGAFAFSTDQRNDMARHLALWLARYHLDDAERALRALPDGAVDDEVRRWRVLTALRRRDWPAVLQHVAGLGADDRAAEQWQYWEAIALKATGRSGPAEERLQALAAERSYYGFLAADALGTDYAWSHRALVADDSMLERIEAMPDIVRARELFFVGLDGRGRSEWESAVRTLEPEQQVQAALLAHRWGWHSRAISTAADNARYDDLQLRYPLPYADEFRRYADDAGISYSWAYGVARSESLFMPDIRSPAGAIGIMQLTPTTGRITAKRASVPYSGLATLTDAAVNIQLGTRYLGELYQRFDNNRVLATAAYNAGPLRVERWIPRDGDLDARIWIDTIPYQETRSYVRRVLTAETIFHWRMAGDTRRLSLELPAIPAVQRVAAADALQP